MRILLILGVTLLVTLAFADHEKGHHKHDKDDHHDDKDHDHRDGHHREGEGHGKKHHHSNDESLPCHEISMSNGIFAFNLYKQMVLDHPNENIVISPISVSTAFAFLSLGAKGRTLSQIIEGIGFNMSEMSMQKIHDGFHHLLHLQNKEGRELQLNSGNALFISEQHKILQTFLEEAKKRYHSEAFSTDFRNNEEAKNKINSYVAKNTNGMIPDLLDSVDPNLVFILINYIYFKGKWENPFDEKWTKEGDFHVNENKTVKVPFMTRTGMYNVAFTDNASMVSIPYKGNTTALFILPDEGKFSEVEQNFNRETLKKWKKSMHTQLVDIFLPKFSAFGKVDLKETLRKMGIVDVFSDNADLSGVTGEANVKLCKAVQKAVLKIDERGTEAAGSTALEAIPMMLPPRMVFDRPFLFILYDHLTHSIPFTGRIVNPQQ